MSNSYIGAGPLVTIPPVVLPAFGGIVENILIGLGIGATVYHGNHYKNEDPNIVYEIFSYTSQSTFNILDQSTFQTEKYGISNRQDPPSIRPESQVRDLNKVANGRIYDWRIRHSQISPRGYAAAIEKYYVTMYAIRNRGNLPPLQVRPVPFR